MSKRVIEVLPSAARTTLQSVVIGPLVGEALFVVVDATVDPTTASITVTMAAHDPLSGKDITLLAGAAIAAVSTTTYRISPQLTASANAIAKDHVPAFVKVSVAVADAESLTYSITALEA